MGASLRALMPTAHRLVLQRVEKGPTRYDSLAARLPPSLVADISRMKRRNSLVYPRLRIHTTLAWNVHCLSVSPVSIEAACGFGCRRQLTHSVRGVPPPPFWPLCTTPSGLRCSPPPSRAAELFVRMAASGPEIGPAPRGRSTGPGLECTFLGRRRSTGSVRGNLGAARRELPSPRQRRHLVMPLESEVRMGFEPTCDGFANRCLTAWLPHQHSSPGSRRRVPALRIDGAQPRAARLTSRSRAKRKPPRDQERSWTSRGGVTRGHSSRSSAR